MLLVEVWLNADKDSLCWELVLRKEVRRLVGLSGGEVAGLGWSQG